MDAFVVRRPLNELATPRPIRTEYYDGVLALDHAPLVDLTNVKDLKLSQLKLKNSTADALVERMRRNHDSYTDSLNCNSKKLRLETTARPMTDRENFDSIASAFIGTQSIKLKRLPISSKTIHLDIKAILCMPTERLNFFFQNVRYIFVEHSYEEVRERCKLIHQKFTVNILFNWLVKLHMCRIVKSRNGVDPCVMMSFAPLGTTIRQCSSKYGDYESFCISTTINASGVYTNVARFCDVFGITFLQGSVRRFDKPVINGMVTSHLCDNGCCLVSAHITYESNSENVLRISCIAKKVVGMECFCDQMTNGLKCHWKTFARHE